MGETRNGYMFAKKCQWCGDYFATNSGRAKFCQDAHRLAAHRAAKSGNGRTLHDLTPETLEKMQQIHGISEPSYNLLFSLLEDKGARIATRAVNAAFILVQEMIEMWEREK